MSSNLLIKNLQVSVGKNKNQRILIDSFNYEFKPGKVYFILGPSGVGKTTLVRHFNGLKRSNVGDITIGRFSILSKDKKIKNIKAIRKEIQLVFQFPEYQLFKSTVIKDVEFGPINFGASKEQANKIAKKYLAKLNLDESCYDTSPFILSNGQKRKAAIAGILAIEPNIIVFDEPTVGLDPQSQLKVINLIGQLKKEGKTIIIVSHNTDNALALADEVLVLSNKKLLACGKPYSIFQNKQILATANINIPNVIKTIDLLSTGSNKFIKLYKLQPKNLDELANCINKLMKGGK